MTPEQAIELIRSDRGRGEAVRALIGASDPGVTRPKYVGQARGPASQFFHDYQLGRDHARQQGRSVVGWSEVLDQLERHGDDAVSVFAFAAEAGFFQVFIHEATQQLLGVLRLD